MPIGKKIMINKLCKATTEEKEILNILSEECAEVIQAISKILRFGFDSTHPSDNTYTNRNHLTEELGDLYCMLNIISQKNIVNVEQVIQYAESKLSKLRKYSDINIEGINNEMH